MSTVMVLGANGRFGRAAVHAFAAAGWQVLAQLRRPPRAALPAGVRVVQADALDLGALRAAAPRPDLIVHALNPDYTRWDRLLPPLTAAVLDLARHSGATLMLPGNVYNFGNALPARLDEATPFAGTHDKARQRIALEAALADAARGGVRSIVIRAGDFLGDQGSWLDLGFARALAKGRVTHMGPDDVEHAWAYLPDLAEVAVRVAARRADLPPHAVLHGPDQRLQACLVEAVRALPEVAHLEQRARQRGEGRGQAHHPPRKRDTLERPAERRFDQAVHLRAGERQTGVVPHTPAAQVVRDSLALRPGLAIASAATAAPRSAARA